jgi:hypothetical protein
MNGHDTGASSYAYECLAEVCKMFSSDSLNDSSHLGPFNVDK